MTSRGVKSLMVLLPALQLTTNRVHDLPNVCIQAEIAGARNKYWSSFVSHHDAVMLKMGQKAKDDTSFTNNDLEEREKVTEDQTELSRKGSVQSMLLVEKGLRELTSLKVALPRRLCTCITELKHVLFIETLSLQYSSFRLMEHLRSL